jgi:CelD/BcsL family acetyltransferase involved in cellulose biosynthesis
VRDDDAFATMRPEWNALHVKCPTATVFSSHAWLYSWWCHYGRPGRLRILVVRRNEQLVAVVPLMTVLRFGIPVLAGIGTGLSDYGGILLDGQHAEATLRLIVNTLKSDRGWRVLDLTEIRADEPVHELACAWPGPHCDVVASTCLELPGREIDDLLSTLPSKTRGTIRRKLKRVDALDISERHVPPTELAGAVTSMLELHERQWVGRGINPEHRADRFQNFLRRAVTDLAADQMAQVCEYRLDGRLVASEVLVSCPQFVGSYLSGVEPELRDQIDTSTMLLRRDLSIAVNGNRPVLSLLRGLEDYKMRWRPRTVVNRRFILTRRYDPVAACYVAATRARIGAVSLVRSDYPRVAAVLRAMRRSGTTRAARELLADRLGRRFARPAATHRRHALR